ncbi:MAG: Uma2 family endonuclease [Thermomicrobiales bacterium]
MVAQNLLDRPMTAEDLALLPDDDTRHEILGGELIVAASPTERHQWASIRLSRRILEHLDTTGVGMVYAAPFDVRLGRYHLLVPDLSIVLRQNASRITRKRIMGPPDVVVEIISESTKTIDRVRKSAIYADAGVPEYWIVDPDASTILVQTLVDGQYVPVASEDGSAHSHQVPGLVVHPTDIFSTPDWFAPAEDE